MPARSVSVLFIQGGGEGAHAEDHALADSLQRQLGAAFEVHFPPMPGEADPDDDAWKRAIAAQAASSQASILVAHSIGATILADMLAERRDALSAVLGVFLVAPPYIGSGGWDFEGYHLDAAAATGASDGPPLFLYFGLADETVPIDHARLYQRAFPSAVIRRLEGRDHQLGNDLSPVARDVEALLAPKRP